MAIGEHAIVSGSRTTLSSTAIDTNVRDVSEMLELWAHKDTPFLNKIGWEDESGSLKVEWISEHLGFGFVQTSAAIASDASEFTCTTSGMGLTTADAIAQVPVGTMLYGQMSGDDADTFMVVTTIGSTSVGTVGVSQLVASSTAIEASAKLYIVGRFAGEGSSPFPDSSRERKVLSNTFGILREDIKITGSMAQTDMHAIDTEPRHQMAMRLLEMQFKRERSILLSRQQARSSTVAPYFAGILEALTGSSPWGAPAGVKDTSTLVLTEATFNTLVAEAWDNGGTPDVFVCNVKQARKFTDFDKNKVRVVQDQKIGGLHITKYLTDVGIEVGLVPLRKFPVNLGFILDTSKIKMRPKKNRKLIIEKLAKVGDFDRWQLLSEYTLIVRGYNKGWHAGFFDLN